VEIQCTCGEKAGGMDKAARKHNVVKRSSGPGISLKSICHKDMGHHIKEHNIKISSFGNFDITLK